VLLAKTLCSTTFKLALISIGVFGAVVIVLFGYVYWSTTDFVLSRSTTAIEAERATLRNIYDMSGREGRVQALSDAVATASLEGSVYSLADQSFSPVVITGPKRLRRRFSVVKNYRSRSIKKR
jgi:hypothetical protein